MPAHPRGTTHTEHLSSNRSRYVRLCPDSLVLRAISAHYVASIHPGRLALPSQEGAQYAVHPDDIDRTVAEARERGYDPGDVHDLSRRTPAGELLRWRLTRGEGRRLDVPFLIDWGTTRQPGLGGLPVIELVKFEHVAPDPEGLRQILDALAPDAGADVVPGARSGYRLRLRTADGEVAGLGVDPDAGA